MSSRSISVSFNDFEWPWKVGHGGQIFHEDLHNCARTIWPSMNKFCKVMKWRIQRGQARHAFQGGGALVSPKCMGPLPTPILFDLQWPNSAWNTAERGMLLGGGGHWISHVPYPMGQGPIYPKSFWPYGLTQSDQIWHNNTWGGTCF